MRLPILEGFEGGLPSLVIITPCFLLLVLGIIMTINKGTKIIVKKLK